MDKRYQLDKSPIEIRLYFAESGMLISDEDYNKMKNKPKEIVDNKEIYKVDDKDFIVYIERFNFTRASWKLMGRIESLSMMITGQISAVDLAYNQLRYCLKECSLFALEFEKDSVGHERIKNFDKLISEDGIKPYIINEALRRYQHKLENVL